MAVCKERPTRNLHWPSRRALAPVNCIASLSCSQHFETDFEPYDGRELISFGISPADMRLAKCCEAWSSISGAQAPWSVDTHDDAEAKDLTGERTDSGIGTEDGKADGDKTPMKERQPALIFCFFLIFGTVHIEDFPVNN